AACSKPGGKTAGSGNAQDLAGADEIGLQAVGGLDLGDAAAALAGDAIEGVAAHHLVRGAGALLGGGFAGRALRCRRSAGTAARRAGRAAARRRTARRVEGVGIGLDGSRRRFIGGHATARLGGAGQAGIRVVAAVVAVVGNVGIVIG